MRLTSEVITASAASIISDGPHLFWNNNEAKFLEDSIKEFGQTTPVLVQQNEGGLELLSGKSRLEILDKLNQPVLARMVEDADALQKGLLFITENSGRAIDDGMRLTALQYFIPLLDTNELKKEILPRLGVKPKSKDAKLLFGWLDMPANWQAHLAAGRVPLAAGATLARMPKEDLNELEPLFSTFSWSRSNAVNVINWLFETSKMRGISIKEVIEIAEFGAINAQGLSPKDAIAKLTAAAKSVRYPELGKLQNTFATAAREITAGTRWRMNQPNNFETGGAELTIQVKDVAQLEKALEDFETMTTLSPWQKLWNLGGNNG